MRRVVWLVFAILQLAGCACLLGGEAFAVSTIGYHCRLFALWVLEPGLMLGEIVLGPSLYPMATTLDRRFWILVTLGVVFNSALLAVLLHVVLRRPRRRPRS